MEDTKYIDYLTKDGDRWDAIAFAHYGDVSKMNDLIQHNPKVAATPTLPGGIRLLIPIIDSGEVSTNTALLPPWKR